MEEIWLSWVPALLENDLLVALLLFAGTAIVVALWIPGMLLPIAASSGALINVWPATATVVFGALAGSMVIFATTRQFAKGRVPHTIESFLARFEARFEAHGAWFVLALRLVGAPHFLVSASSALMPIKASSFALATLLGLTPAVLLAATAGSAV
jgi:uncharacterized membrane protein YdjX (TVP38/TMEM64 family)